MDLIPWRSKRSEDKAELVPIARFREELDRLFDSFFREGRDSIDRLLAPLGGWGPAVDITEDDRTITVQAEVPGVKPDDIDLRVTGDLLTISGAKKQEHEETRGGYRHLERRFGSFERMVRLPGEVDPDKVEAEYRNGVLVVKMNRAPGSVRKRITVTKPKE
jgi:HSP20 family protein